MKRKVAGIAFLIGSLYYIIAEAISELISMLPFSTLIFSTPFQNSEFQMGIHHFSF